MRWKTQGLEGPVLGKTLRKKKNPGLLDQMRDLGADQCCIGLGCPMSRSLCRHTGVWVYPSGMRGKERMYVYVCGGGVCTAYVLHACLHMEAVCMCGVYSECWERVCVYRGVFEACRRSWGWIWVFG